MFFYSVSQKDMTQSKRSKNLEKFQFDDETPVFLLSIRAGAVGLTLTAANHCNINNCFCAILKFFYVASDFA